jgi:hypothetical protein
LKSKAQSSGDSKQLCDGLIFSFIDEGFVPVIPDLKAQGDG